MGLLKRLFGASDRGTAPQLYAGIVARGRAPHWYTEGGVPDTIDGRFDMIAAVLSLVLLRLEGEAEAKAPSTALAECFIDDMDGQLRQTGLGDLVVGKHVGRLMGTLGGRLGALREALPQDDAALAEVIVRNVTLVEGGDAAKLVPAVRRLANALAALSADDLMAARIER